MTLDNLRQMQTELHIMRQQLLQNAWPLTADMTDSTPTFEVMDTLRQAGRRIQKAEHSIAVALWEYERAVKRPARVGNGSVGQFSDEPDSDGGEL